jgi:hypothetical protein
MKFRSVLHGHRGTLRTPSVLMSLLLLNLLSAIRSNSMRSPNGGRSTLRASPSCPADPLLNPDSSSYRYSALKKRIYELSTKYEPRLANGANGASHERAGLLTPTNRCDSEFIPLLDKELDKITSFYYQQEKELQEELDALQAEIEEQEERGFMPPYRDGEDDDDDDDDEEEGDGSHKGIPRRKRKASMGTCNQLQDIMGSDLAAFTFQMEAMPWNGLKSLRMGVG